MLKLWFNCNGNVIQGLYNFLPVPGLRLLPFLYSTLTSSISHDTDFSEVKHSSLSDFLVDTLGFNKDDSTSISAMLAKRRQRRGTTKVTDLSFISNAQSVVFFFKQLGFREFEIKKLVSKQPLYLMSRVEKSLKPKVEQIKELGISDSDLVQMISRNHELLRIRLEPVIHTLRIVMGKDEDVVLFLKRERYLGWCAVNLQPNVELLQNMYGIPIKTIRLHILRQPSAFLLKADMFRDILIRVEEELEIPRNSTMFMYGIKLLVCYDKKRLRDKFAIFKSFGWTRSHLTALIRQNPICLTSSESKIKEKLDFLMNEVGYTPDFIVSRSSLFTYSVEKRLLPRHRILQFLKEKRLLRIDYLLFSVSILSESDFVKRFVLPYEEVHEVYTQLTGSTVELINAGKAKGNPKDNT
ncbi:Transcription termination factor MTEF18 mitochondrial [Bienertia sinuspersici]